MIFFKYSYIFHTFADNKLRNYLISVPKIVRQFFCINNCEQTFDNYSLLLWNVALTRTLLANCSNSLFSLRNQLQLYYGIYAQHRLYYLHPIPKVQQ